MLRELLLLSFGLTPVIGLTQVKPDAAAMAAMQWMQGKWSCEGRFVRSGKPISANVSFEPALDGKILLFRHDDKPLFSYHALSEWGYSISSKHFVSTIQDSAGGFRYFESEGWRNGQLVWEGDAIKAEKPSAQRFVFEKKSEREFQVSYSLQREGNWVNIDSSTCMKEK